MKKKLSLLLALMMILTMGFYGCGSDDAADDGGNAEVSKDTAILVVSFGTSFNDSRDITIGAIEKDIQAAFPEYKVRTAYTAQIIIDKLEERDGLEIDNVTEALDRAAADGIKNLVVQPTHLMNGLEYNDLKEELAEYQDTFEKISLGAPLLTSEDDFDKVVAAITEATKEQNNEETAIVYMGHGTEADSNQVYAKMQEKLADADFGNYYIGTVEAEPTLEDVIAAMKDGGYKKVVLSPLMVVCGDHANNDMAGDEEDSWKSVLTKEGYEVECLMQGLGQIDAIRAIYVAHTQAAVDALK